MKKLFALMLALVMMVTASFALADTFELSFKVNTEEAGKVLPSMGIPAEQVAKFQPIFNLLNALSLKVITANQGAQLDLNVNGTTALTIGGAPVGNDIVIGASLIPNYLLKVTEEDAQNLMGQLSQSMPGLGGEGGFNPEKLAGIAEKYMGYVAQVIPTFQTALTPGEPETGSWAFEGYTFDTKTPINVDTKAIGEAVSTLMDNLMNDEEIVGLFSAFGGSFNPQEVLAGVKDAMSEEHMPDVTVEVYNIAGQQLPYYAKSEATYKGASEPSFTFWMLGKEDQSMYMEFNMVGQNMTFALTVDPANAQGILEMIGAEEGKYVAVGLKLPGANQFQIDLFLAEKTELLSIFGSITQGEGALTVNLDETGKTILSLADLMGGNLPQELQQEATTNLFQLMAIPEIAGVMATFTGGMQ